MSKRYIPHIMSETTESRLIKTCEAAKREENPSISKIAREYGVCQRALCDRAKKSAIRKSSKKLTKRALNDAQEEALTRWIVKMNNCSMPPPPKLIEEWTNASLTSIGKPNKPVSKM